MPGADINLGQQLWDMAAEMFERGLRGEPPLEPVPETEPPPAPFTGEVFTAGVQYPVAERTNRRAVSAIKVRVDGTSEEGLLADGSGNLLFPQTEAARFVRHIQERAALPLGAVFVPEPEGWRAGLEDRPFFDYFSECGGGGGGVDVFPSPTHYRRHIVGGEKPCGRAAAEMAEWERSTRCDTECGLECDCGPFLWVWDEYRGDVPLANRPHRVYRIRFPLPGGGEDWYYGITSKVLPARIFGHNAETGGRSRAGEPYTAETLCVMDGKKAAAMVERELIRDGNPTGGRLINKVHNPERRRGG